MFAYDMKTRIEWDGTKYVTKYEFTFFFKTKEEYLKQRQGWRKEYKELSRRLHNIKLEVKNLQREGKWTEVWKRQRTLAVLKEKARMMMECKMQSKMESIRQKELHRKVA
jgi:hypothetical protein